jgi:hypothetical protein
VRPDHAACSAGIGRPRGHILTKLPKRPALHARVRAAYSAALDGATSPREAEHGLRTLVGELGREFPSAAACRADDLAALMVHLAYPLRLKKRPRSTSLPEHSLEEVRRRTKVIGRCPGKTSVSRWPGPPWTSSLRGLGASGLRCQTVMRSPASSLPNPPADCPEDRLTYPC